MENKYVIMHNTIKTSVKEGFCSFCSTNKVRFDKKVCLECENTQSAREADYKRYLNEIEQIRRLFLLCNWKEVS
ncbi:MAG: hypothetical protein HeimC3_10250 [Candidatus Heimdallarchaeota archaeon LC_3]|nr:MAG: hypothetical protein HeimC3_10250 [Candidatus Heimdallarchaeota archaeon LC_3]